MATPRNKYDKRHLKNVAKYKKQIDDIFEDAEREVATIAHSLKGVNTATKTFSFADFPSIRGRIDALLSNMQKSILSTITTGIELEWSLANQKNDDLVSRVFGDVKNLLDYQSQKYLNQNGGALTSFTQREVDGMNLSNRVWQYTNAFKDEIEMGLSVGIGEGRSAISLYNVLNNYLQHPDKMYGDVREKYGTLTLNQETDYHPGRGVYRSAYKNCVRLAGTETNIAYRTADHERWQQFDFVVGIEVHTSNNHTLNGKPFDDICDELEGEYPKDFKFVGWHPNCRCYATTILKTPQEMEEDTRRILEGEEPLPPSSSENFVEYPNDGFITWVQNNEERMEDANSVPYFLSDNQEMVESIIDGTLKT